MGFGFPGPIGHLIKEAKERISHQVPRIIETFLERNKKMTYGCLFNNYKEQIRMAITKSKIKDYEDENGQNVYNVVTKEEAVERVIELYDETIYHLEQFAAASKAIEKILKENCPDLDKSEFLREYIELMEKELQSSDYRYDSDIEEERDSLRGSFKVIDGGKKE